MKLKAADFTGEMEGPLGARSFLIANGEFLAAHERRIRSWRRRYQRRGRECDRLTPRKWSDHSRSSFNVPNGCQRWTYSRDFDLEIYKRVSERGTQELSGAGKSSWAPRVCVLLRWRQERWRGKNGKARGDR
jgi:hypothetical protein